MYAATSYIGREYIPGEVLADDVPEELIDRWKRAGAIREIEGTAPPADLQEDAPPQPEDENDEDLEPEEIEPEEIDATAGIVTGPSKTTRKNGGKKS